MALDQAALDRGKRLFEAFGIFGQALGNRYFLPFTGNDFEPLRQPPQFPVVPPRGSCPAASNGSGDQRKGREIFGTDMNQARAGDKNGRQRQAAQ